jgi:7,8-dihydro-6-hydroxymethylpterin-pyrophosphokinase
VDYNNSYLNLFEIIKKIEKKLGRIQTKKNDPRVIDIDIIDFKSEVTETKELILPHPRCHLRNFVLFPILQIDPNWSHPILKKNARFLINNLNRKFRIEITRLQKNVIIQT